MVYFVTGASGFVGSSLVRRMVARGDRVRALCRGSAVLPEGVEAVPGDLLDADSLRHAMTGCQRVFHLAAHARAGGPEETYERVNVTGTQHVFDVARSLGCERVVMTSTAATLGPTGSLVHDEGNVHDGPWFTPYEETKRRAEDVALASGLAVLVHPSRVFGPGPLTQSNALTRLIDLYRRGLFRFKLGRGRSIGNYVFVDDVAEGHLQAMDCGQTGERYLLGGENVRLSELLDAIGQASGRHRYVVGVPQGWVRWLASLEETRASWMGAQPAVSADHVDRFIANYAFCIDKARRDLGYAPRSLSTGLAETLEWLDAR
jgi:nucleoside-diphosphate-sugar epimerase